MISRITLTITGLFLALISTASPYVNLEFGANVHNFLFSPADFAPKKSYALGGRIGVSMGHHIQKEWYFEYGLHYVTNGYVTPHTDFTLHTVQIPLDFVFKPGGFDSKGMLLGVGVFGGLYANTSDYHNVFNPIDMGMDVNAGYMASKDILLKIRGQLGFVELSTVQGLSLNSFNIGFSVNYILSRHHVKKPMATPGVGGENDRK